MATDKEQKSRIQSLIRGPLEEAAAELVDIELKGNRGNKRLRIFVDTPDGISIGDCAQLSRAIADVLEMEEVFPGRYILEVSSPGTDRPLRTPRDFRRNLDREVTVVLISDQGQVDMSGVIKFASEKELKLATSSGEETIEFSDIVKGKLKLPW